MNPDQKRTIVLGASTNPSRYSFVAVQRLQSLACPVIPVGIRTGEINGIKIINDFNLDHQDIHTITLYLSEAHQAQYLDWILRQKPRRVIFNPGTENPSMMNELSAKGIEVTAACTLVMLSTGQY